MTIIQHVLSIEVSFEWTSGGQFWVRAGFATLLSSHTGDPGRR